MKSTRSLCGREPQRSARAVQGKQMSERREQTKERMARYSTRRFYSHSGQSVWIDPILQKTRQSGVYFLWGGAYFLRCMNQYLIHEEVQTGSSTWDLIGLKMLRGDKHLVLQWTLHRSSILWLALLNYQNRFLWQHCFFSFQLWIKFWMVRFFLKMKELRFLEVTVKLCECPLPSTAHWAF